VVIKTTDILALAKNSFNFTITLALRLPSAFAGLGTCLLLYYFAKNVLNSRRLGFFAALVLVTTQGYVSNHVVRSGDYDGLVIFFVVAYVLFFYKHIENGFKPIDFW